MSTLSDELGRVSQQTLLMAEAMHDNLNPIVEEATDVLLAFKKKMNSWCETIYVTVGHPYSPHPLLNKTAVWSNEPTFVQSAKMVRKAVADNITEYGFPKGIKMKPSELYYVIHTRTENGFQYYWSSLNARSEAKDVIE